MGSNHQTMNYNSTILKNTYIYHDLFFNWETERKKWKKSKIRPRLDKKEYKKKEKKMKLELKLELKLKLKLKLILLLNCELD